MYKNWVSHRLFLGYAIQRSQQNKLRMVVSITLLGCFPVPIFCSCLRGAGGGPNKRIICVDALATMLNSSQMVLWKCSLRYLLSSNLLYMHKFISTKYRFEVIVASMCLICKPSLISDKTLCQVEEITKLTTPL